MTVGWPCVAVHVGAQTTERAPAPETPAPVQAAAPPGGGTAAAGGPAHVTPDLSTRYRFIEPYPKGLDPTKAAPGEITAYQVASRDVIKVVSDKPQGAPAHTERTVQIIYTERPLVVTGEGVVTDTVRRYEAFLVSPADPAAPSAAPPLKGLSVWYQSRASGGTGGSGPLLIALDPGRSVTETEYAVSLRQIFLPDLAHALPASPSRVDDHWRLPPVAAQALLGERPSGRAEPLTGTLVEVRPSTDGKELVAVISVSGRALLPTIGDTLLNAQILFQFLPSADPTAPTVDARGSIREVRLARTSTSSAPGPNVRLKARLTWELILQRRPAPSAAPLPAVPEKRPEKTQDNSWLTFADPKGRFHFRHPQDFLPQKLPLLEQDDMVQLGDAQAGANEGRIITIKLQPKTGNAEEDRNSRDPAFHVKELKDEWDRSHQDVHVDPAGGWLPEADWTPSGMKVYRIQAALKPNGPEARNLQRIFLDHYLVLFTRNESLVIDAMTGQDDPRTFRKQVEEILKTFKLSPLNPPGAATPHATRAPAAPAPTPGTPPPASASAPQPAPAPSPARPPGP
jgi:hypothetical protein